MKLINPKSPNARLAIAGDVIEADDKGMVEIDDEDIAASLLNSGYMLVEKHEADSKIKADADKRSQARADKVSAAAVKAAKAEAATAKKEAAKIEDEPSEDEEDADAPKRGWQRGASKKKTSSKK